MKKFFFVSYLILLSFILNQNLNSIENKIEFKIDNEIVTTIDIIKELNFLTALSPKILELDKDKIFEISKNSVIREKIKKLEVQKFNQKLEIDKTYLKKLIMDSYSKINLESEKEFKEYLSRFNLKFEDFKKKIIIEALWNQLIYLKFKSKINIDKEKLKKEIIKNKTQKSTSFNLSEIVFNIEESEKLEKKYKKIKEDIKEKGFENSALIYSVSGTANLGGELGWINENSINKKLKILIKKLKIGDYTKPYVVPGGFLIIKLNNLKKIDKKINIEDELKKLVIIKTNQQLNQFSNIYFNKIKKNKKIEKI